MTVFISISGHRKFYCWWYTLFCHRVHLNIYNLINYAKSKLPQARIEIISNGDVLNAKRLKKLYESGLDRIQISLYDGEEQHLEFVKLGKTLKLTSNQYVLRPRYLPEEKDFGAPKGPKIVIW